MQRRLSLALTKNLEKEKNSFHNAHDSLGSQLDQIGKERICYEMSSMMLQGGEGLARYARRDMSILRPMTGMSRKSIRWES